MYSNMMLFRSAPINEINLNYVTQTNQSMVAT